MSIDKLAITTTTTATKAREKTVTTAAATTEIRHRFTYFKNISLSLLTLPIILLLIKTYYYSNFATNSRVSPYINVETLDLTVSQQNDLKRLGLTLKKPVQITTIEKGKQIIHGRFLHITDIHPDPFFKIGSSFEDACHSSKGTAQKYGDAISGCDSPMILMNETIKWIAENLKDKIDFIVWTGDNIRHDNDRNFPRTEKSIFEMNDKVSQLLYETFKKDNTPELQVDLIPSLGNNDVFPHNLFSIGPTLQTRELYQIWQKFIPQSQLHIFNRGAYFFKEVIPGQLVVLSINTLYWFQSNPLVDNCDERTEPGYKLFEWLGYVLKEIRARKMKVWFSGHVPPNEKNYDLTCLRNVAAYKSINKSKKKKKNNNKNKTKAQSTPAQDDLFQGGRKGCEEEEEEEENDDTKALGETSLFKSLESKFDDGFFRIQGGVPKNKVKYMETLREDLYAPIKGKKKSGRNGERYSISFVSSSIVPTFNPGIRVWEYNITNLAKELPTVKFEPWDKFLFEVDALIERQSKYTNKEQESYLWAFGRSDKTFPLPMPKDAPLGPAYVPQTYTPERYVNYYADLTAINKGTKEFGYEIEYTTDDQNYNMPVLTTEEWLKLARSLGRPLKKVKGENEKENGKKKKKKKKNPNHRDDELKNLEKLWTIFLKDAFVSSDYEHTGLG
ncbi:PPN1 [Candida oxycetoniae]|uniref:Endopolyphosphatase n=1 Tax=Candida oxycetoniae TaxID=497107 RepID=A0AAI9WY11_9ASCO|nr:PPN1 [Candida oxycetoniae]KAI3404783.2 PPN1 [Candida oxycetoniae]